MPFLRDEGPPVSQATIQRARESLPLEFGFQVVNETGRGVLLVRVPKVKPDYLHDLAEVAFYVDLDTVRDTRDILLIGHEKTARLEPQLLRDHIRAQQREDESVVQDLRRRLGAAYGYGVVQSPSNHTHKAIALRIPKSSVADFSPEDVVKFREVVQNAKGQAESCQYAYIVAEKDFERLGRRVLLELLGIAPGAPAPAEPAAAPIAAPAPVPTPAPTPAPAPAPSARPTFPPTPGTPAAAAAAPRAAPIAPPPGTPEGLASMIASAAAAPSPTPPQAAAASPASIPAVEAVDEANVEIHEEYEIISRPKGAYPAPAPAPAQTPMPTPAAAPIAIEDEDDAGYEIMSSSPRAATPAPAPAPAAAPSAPAPRAAASVPIVHDDGRIIEKATESFEVYSSKPRARQDAPSITPPGAGGFQNALNGAMSAAAAPAKTKEYEIMGRASPPPLMSAQPPAAPAPTYAPPQQPAAPAHGSPQYRAPDDPRVISPRASLPIPGADSGTPILARTAPANPEGILAARFREAGYEIVEGLKAQGTVFSFAAHKPNGRRVLVKRSGDFGAEDAASLAQLAVALGADVCLVVADRIAPGTRMATWGTRIEVYAAADVPQLAF